jgi:EmrB/QacA subfamily drug resistance transporter
LPPSEKDISEKGPLTKAQVDNDGKLSGGARLATLAVGSALMMQFLDSTALVTALPTLSRAFGTDPVHLRSVLTTYMVVQALFLPASGWMADRFGPRKVFTWAMAVFLTGSLLCGLSHGLGQLIAARIVQGLGGAMMMPVGRTIVINASPRNALVTAMMWLTLPAMVGPMIGPALAGVILQVAEWPWIFFVNVPVGLLGIAAVLRFVPRTLRPHPGSFDFVGFLMIAAIVSAIMVLVETIDLHPSPILLQAGSAIGAVLFGFLYLGHVKRRTAKGLKPVLDLSLMRFATFRSAQTGGTLLRMGIGGSPYLMQLLLQFGLHWSALHASLVTISSSLGAISARLMGPRVIRKVGFKNMLLIAITLSGFLGMAPGFFRETTPIWLIMCILPFTGFVRATQMSAGAALSFAEIPDESISQGSTLSSVIQQISMSLGVTFAALMLHLSQGSSHVLTPEVFVLPYVAVGLVTFLALPPYLALPANAGAEMSGRGRGHRVEE